ncbi:MAG TPA: hypothetical protein VG456_09550 [Candidatus Sulfopaludibacter sp.]|jgi:hypothetical protein|nr:hypothetical protein [Candidatus Sulfopaludibacter sp.]
MKLFAAFTAAVSSAAILFALEFFVEGVAAGVRLSSTEFAFGVALNLLIGVPVTLVGGVPIWILFRNYRVQSPKLFALTGGALALMIYLLLVGLGMGKPSDHPMMFLENLSRPFQVPRIAAAIVAGSVGAYVFWLVQVRPSSKVAIPST